jgi:hypothetical protein
MVYMKKELVIEWKHIGNEIEKTREEFEETGMTLAAVLAEIRMLLEMEGVAVRMVETVLPDEVAMEPERLLFNGVPVEELLEGVEVTATSCSCASCESCETCGEGGGVPDAPLQRRGVRGDPAGTDRAGRRKSPRAGVNP